MMDHKRILDPLETDPKHTLVRGFIVGSICDLVALLHITDELSLDQETLEPRAEVVQESRQAREL